MIGNILAWRWANLAGVVKREPEEENVRKRLHDAEESVNHPVSQPLSVVLLHRALDGFDSEQREKKTDFTVYTKTGEVQEENQKNPFTSGRSLKTGE